MRTVLKVQTYTPPDLSAETVAGVAPADVIYLAAQPDDALHAAQLVRAAGFSTRILGGDGLRTFRQLASPSLPGVSKTIPTRSAWRGQYPAGSRSSSDGVADACQRFPS